MVSLLLSPPVDIASSFRRCKSVAYCFCRKKYEIATNEIGNPIKQDEKKGALREFKKGDIFFNYGCFPQTWEDPTFIHPDADGCRGDNDPLDVCEIGARIIGPGVSVCSSVDISTSMIAQSLLQTLHSMRLFSFNDVGYSSRQGSWDSVHDRRGRVRLEGGCH